MRFQCYAQYMNQTLDAMMRHYYKYQPSKCQEGNCGFKMSTKVSNM